MKRVIPVVLICLLIGGSVLPVVSAQSDNFQIKITHIHVTESKISVITEKPVHATSPNSYSDTVLNSLVGCPSEYQESRVLSGEQTDIYEFAASCDARFDDDNLILSVNSSNFSFDDRLVISVSPRLTIHEKGTTPPSKIDTNSYIWDGTRNANTVSVNISVEEQVETQNNRLPTQGQTPAAEIGTSTTQGPVSDDSTQVSPKNSEKEGSLPLSELLLISVCFILIVLLRKLFK